jgi:hypothetical protein
LNSDDGLAGLSISIRGDILTLDWDLHQDELSREVLVAYSFVSMELGWANELPRKGKTDQKRYLVSLS